MRMASLERCSKVLKQHVNRVEGENQLMNNFQENVSTLFMQGKVFCEGSKTGLLQKSSKCYLVMFQPIFRVGKVKY